MSNGLTRAFRSDDQFVTAAGGILTGVGVVMVLLGLSCKVLEWGYCYLELVPMFGGDPRFIPDLSSINLPLAMLLIGTGSRLRSPYGWWIVMIMLAVMVTTFCFLTWYHWYRWPMEELANGTWARVSMADYPYADALVSSAMLALLSLCGFGYWLTPELRDLFWHRNAPRPSDISS